MPVFLNAIGTAVPPHDVHRPFVAWAEQRIGDDRQRRLFSRMAARSGIEHRWSVLPPVALTGSPDDSFYAGNRLPGTAARMAVYAEHAPELVLGAVAALDAEMGGALEPERITHLVLASCTGFVAPGIDQIVARRLGLAAGLERTLIGFMGCYAAVVALRTARHIVRSEPAARVLVVCVELCTLHLQETDDVESLLAQLQFGDGAAAALVSGDETGLELGQPFSTTLPQSDTLIRWDITDQGFAMHLSGEVPARIGAALASPEIAAAATGGRAAGSIRNWAVHAGGRSILDAVSGALVLPGDALDPSRAVLRANGNMSSATLLFVLARMLAGPRVGEGVALAFGPGLAAEGLAFRSAP
ncbi:type III polyketide synthase [Sphingomonas aracearum]|uniref:Type III polyketide synthase n=1 Tax=Sphingomonas aracearum TaxID=2283317 RepID=A0A369VSI7_9SPHN|nr:type III polyketide synthase [Sphingomonas aracearum]RDE04635.1 type III polyketide synthase [Sphingomonas aracearum]